VHVHNGLVLDRACPTITAPKYHTFKLCSSPEGETYSSRAII